MGGYQRRLQARLRDARKGPEERVVPQSDFKLRRRMFAVVGGQARVAEVGDARFHREWLSDVPYLEFDRVIRGYHLDGDVVFYRGTFQIVSIPEIRESLPGLMAMIDLPGDTHVFSGARPAGGDDLRGAHLCGTVDDLLETWPEPSDETLTA